MSAILEDYFRGWYAEHGILDLDDIHDDVARPNHPLHDRYEWDDVKAGREYRKQQIARDIRLVERTFTKSDGSEQSVREFWANREIGQGNRGYSSVQDMNDPQVLTFIKASMEMEMRSMYRRFGHLEEYFAVLQEQLRERQTARRKSSKSQPRSTSRKPRKRV